MEDSNIKNEEQTIDLLDVMDQLGPIPGIVKSVDQFNRRANWLMNFAEAVAQQAKREERMRLNPIVAQAYEKGFEAAIDSINANQKRLTAANQREK